MRLLFFFLVLPCIVAVSQAADVPRRSAAATVSAPAASDFRGFDVKAVTSSGLGQAGYVHYFLITHDDGSLEYHVGIELEDQRIAWSFPNGGVIVSEFIKKGTISVNGKDFKIEHLHGIRPFNNAAEMRTLQKEITPRVAQWVDDETPYCLFRRPGEPFCVSCGDFVVRILYPGFSPLVPALPRDFSQGPGRAATTDDLLLYLVGIHNLPDKHARLARLAKLDLPPNMREDIIAMIEDGEPGTPDTAIAAAPSPTPPLVKPAATVATPAKPDPSRMAIRRPQNRRL